METGNYSHYKKATSKPQQNKNPERLNKTHETLSYKK